MNNRQLSEMFANTVKELEETSGKSLPRDYFDRAVDIAIFFNDTIDDAENAEAVIEEVRMAMLLAYSKRENITPLVAEEEVNDANSSAEEVSRD